MNSHFDSSSSGVARLVSVLAAVVVTAALFSAVVIGLTGEEGGSAIAEVSAAAAVLA